MFERDYIVRMLVELAAAIRRSMERAREQQDLEGAAATLENSIGEATDLDGSVLLSLAPESIAQVLQVSNTDPRAVVYIAHSMQLQSHYLSQMGDEDLAELRLRQAKALADTYKFDLPEDMSQVDDKLFDDEEFLQSIEQMSKDVQP